MKTNEELEIIANDIASKVIVRSHDNFSSVDYERPSTSEENKIIYKICIGALKSYREVGDNRKITQGILDCAENTFIQFFNWDWEDDEHLNSYLTLYLPLRKVFDEWE